MNAIDVQDIVKKFGDFTAVNGISFDVDEGEIFGLLGPNGAGKSTLIRMLTTLLPPTAGTALVNGFDIVKQADGVRRSIGDSAGDDERSGAERRREPDYLLEAVRRPARETRAAD